RVVVEIHGGCRHVRVVSDRRYGRVDRRGLWQGQGICPSAFAGLTCCAVAPRCYTRPRSGETRVAIVETKRGSGATGRFWNGRRGPHPRRPRPSTRMAAHSPRPAGARPLLAERERGGPAAPHV